MACLDSSASSGAASGVRGPAGNIVQHRKKNEEPSVSGTPHVSVRFRARITYGSLLDTGLNDKRANSRLQKMQNQLQGISHNTAKNE